MLTRRAFLKLSALGAAALVAMRYIGAQAQSAARAVACIVVPGGEVPLAVPMIVGDDCRPAPTAEPTGTPLAITLSPSPTVTTSPTLSPMPTVTASATPSPMSTDIPTPTGTPTAAPTGLPAWRTWFPWVTRGG